MEGAIVEEPSGAMEPWCWARVGGQGPRGPRVPGASRSCTRARALLLLMLLMLLLLMLLLLPRWPAGCMAAGESPRALSTTVPTDPGVSCGPRATCPSGRLPRQASAAATTAPPTWALSRVAPMKTTKPSHFSFCGTSHEPDPTLRDPEAMTRRWPWMVSVQANGVHICAGTLIASQWVLTVAHCLTQDGANYSVRVGSPWINQMTTTSTDVPVRQIIINSGYQARRYWSWVGRVNDIGLLKLQSGLKYSRYVWPICLPGVQYVVEDSSLCTVTGWGHPKVNDRWPQFQSLQEKDVTIMNSRKCEQFYHKFSRIPSLVRIINSQMICASDDNRENFCYELTGEPLVCSVDGTWYLVGMMSWGPGCKQNKTPPIFVQVSTFQLWIWGRLSGKAVALAAPSRTLLLAFLLLLSLLGTL